MMNECPKCNYHNPPQAVTCRVCNLKLPRSNPHTPVSDAKEFYKQFHQKPAKNVKKTKVDIGDTWVGLGKAWSIGYRSGKETGNEAQKYIHNFGVDEESRKQFKEPDLYYVKNNDGSQMMVIMGGDWYIDVDCSWNWCVH